MQVSFSVNFGKCGPILIILSQLYSEINPTGSWSKICYLPYICCRTTLWKLKIYNLFGFSFKTLMLTVVRLSPRVKTISRYAVRDAGNTEAYVSCWWWQLMRHVCAAAVTGCSRHMLSGLEMQSESCDDVVQSTHWNTHAMPLTHQSEIAVRNSSPYTIFYSIYHRSNGANSEQVYLQQEAQLLLGDRATRKHAKESWNGRRNDNLGWNDLQMYFKVIKSGTNRKLVYDFLLVVYLNFCRITHRFFINVMWNSPMTLKYAQCHWQSYHLKAVVWPWM